MTFFSSKHFSSTLLACLLIFSSLKASFIPQWEKQESKLIKSLTCAEEGLHPAAERRILELACEMKGMDETMAYLAEKNDIPTFEDFIAKYKPFEVTRLNFEEALENYNKTFVAVNQNSSLLDLIKACERTVEFRQRLLQSEMRPDPRAEYAVGDSLKLSTQALRAWKDCILNIDQENKPSQHEVLCTIHEMENATNNTIERLKEKKRFVNEVSKKISYILYIQKKHKMDLGF